MRPIGSLVLTIFLVSVLCGVSYGQSELCQVQRHTEGTSTNQETIMIPGAAQIAWILSGDTFNVPPGTTKAYASIAVDTAGSVTAQDYLQIINSGNYSEKSGSKSGGFVSLNSSIVQLSVSVEVPNNACGASASAYVSW